VLLSTQTQLASLRGALEASRLREEKHKTEMEKVVKEVDVLRWEHANSRRGEIEVGFFFVHRSFAFLGEFATVSI
jgi:anthranilate synthase/indole-3-glycerol phosphate synthase/phosphoribosylanthranilate isomerase